MSSLSRALEIPLAFVGLLVGAGFATGQEVIQYFISFGSSGLCGAVVAGLLMVAAGAVIIQVGSYFLATEHKMVFKNVAHPVISWFLDISITVTLFAVGFVMLAGAGSTLEQQFGLPAWIGALIMTVLVRVTGLRDVDKVSSIISGITPLIVVAVVIAFIYSMAQLPNDPALSEAAAEPLASPMRPWWLSAMNYTGMALLMGVSMSLVIGGTVPNPRRAMAGGLGGGVLFTVLLLMSAVALYVNLPAVAGQTCPC